MRTEKQFLCGIHERAAALRRARERRRTAAWSALCVALTVLLAWETLASRAPGRAALTGASLLDVSAGGYVLVAVLAFMAGVAVTALLKRREQTQKTEEEPE